MALLEAAEWCNDALTEGVVAKGWPRLNRSQALVFARIDGQGTRPAELARRLGISRQGMQQLLESLVANGLVEVRPDPTDLRASIAVLTPAGSRLGADAAEIDRRVERELRRRIGAEHVAALRAALDQSWGSAVRP